MVSLDVSSRVTRRMLFFRKDREDVYSEGERLMKDRRVRDGERGGKEGKRDAKMVAVQRVLQVYPTRSYTRILVDRLEIDFPSTENVARLTAF